jgi:hypothetical protein
MNPRIALVRHRRTLRISRGVGLMQQHRLLTLTLIACLFSIAGSLLAASQDTNETELAELSDEELLQEYERAGLALAEEGIVISNRHDHLNSLMHSNNTSTRRWLDVKEEVQQRGSEIVPELIALLEIEAPLSRQASGYHQAMSLTAEILELMVAADDPRCVNIMLRILEGWDGKVTPGEQRNAVYAIERLTRCRFRESIPHHDTYAESVEHEDALPSSPFPEPEVIAEKYRVWLGDINIDMVAWKASASIRAHEILDGPDLRKTYCAAAYLSYRLEDDGDPDATIQRLASILDRMKKEEGPYAYSITYSLDEGSVPVPVHVANWMGMLAAYGPRARPFAASLLRIQQDQELNRWSGYALLRRIGGPEIVAYCIEVLPDVSKEAEHVRSITPEGTGFSSDDPEGWWFDSQREVRFGIDRWAGRLFETDAERYTWWEANREKSPETWLRDNLRTVVQQTDDNVLWARWIAYEILPDMPKTSPEEDEDVPNGDAFRTRWLDENIDTLEYDPLIGCFRVK